MHRYRHQFPVEVAAYSQVDAYASAIEIAAGQLSSAFAAASIAGAGAAVFTPWVLAQIGRALIDEGEAVWFRLGRELTRARNYTFLSAANIGSQIRMGCGR